MENTPRLKTERLLLRQFTLNDLPAFYQIGSDKDVNQFLPFFPFQTMEQAKQHLREQYLKSYTNPSGFRYAVCLQTDNIPIGYVTVANNESHDFGYALKKEFWHQGIITEASTAILTVLQAAGLPYITATHDRNNPRSGNVMKKIGMTYCYSYEEQWQPKNKLVTFRMYQLNWGMQAGYVYPKYWDGAVVHFIESGI